MLIRTLGTVSLLTFALTGQAREMTLLETVTTKSVARVDMSPDGQYTAVLRYIPRVPYEDDDGSGFTELALIDRQGEETVYLSREQTFSRVTFGPNSDYLYFTAQRDDDDYNELYRIPVDGGAIQSFYEFDGNIADYDLSSDGTALIFTSQGKPDKDKKTLAKKGFKAEVYEEELDYTHLYHVDLSAEEKTATQVSEAEQHILSAQFHPDNQHILARVAPTPLIDDNYMSSQYHLLTPAGDIKQSFETAGKLGQADFSPDGRYLALIAASSYNDPSAGTLMVWDSRSEEMRNVLPDYQGSVRDFSWRTDQELVWLGHRGTESEVQALTLKFLENRVLIEPGEAIFTSLDGEPGVSEISLRGNRPEHPNEAFRLSDSQLQRLTVSNPWLDEITLPRQVTVSYEARDGLQLEGVLVYPTDYQQGESYPTIMVIHGGPEAHYSNGWLDRYGSPVKHAAANGYALFFPNYRGSTGRGVEFSMLSQNDYAGKEFDDIVDAKQHLVAEGIADPERVGITGGSYGGYAAAWGATKQTEHFAASVMFVGISDNISKFGTTDIAKEMNAVHARSYPWEKWQWYLERSPIYYAEQARTPILIMHGKEDTRVHPSQSMELYRYLKTHANVPVRLVLYPGEGHGNRKMAAQLDYSQRLMRWMDNFLIEQAEVKPPHQLPHGERISSDD
ncbi:MAG: prolyl oligopeptidase family serine peptidase [Pseudomonadota bacterium]